MNPIENLDHLEIVSDCPGSFVLLLGFPKTGNGLLCAKLEVGQLVPSVRGQRLPEVAHLPPRGHVQLSSVRCSCLDVPSKLLLDHMLVSITLWHQLNILFVSS